MIYNVRVQLAVEAHDRLDRAEQVVEKRTRELGEILNQMTQDEMTAYFEEIGRRHHVAR